MTSIKRYRLKKDTPMIKAGTIFKTKRNDFGDGTDLIRITPEDHDPAPMWTKEDIKDFDEWFEDVKSEYQFEDGDEYWFVDGEGLATSTRWKCDDFDIFHYESGNHFKTEDESREYAEYLKDVAKVRRHSGLAPKHSDRVGYIIYKDLDEIIVTDTTVYELGAIYFPSEEVAELVAKTLKPELERIFEYTANKSMVGQ